MYTFIGLNTYLYTKSNINNNYSHECGIIQYTHEMNYKAYVSNKNILNKVKRRADMGVGRVCWQVTKDQGLVFVIDVKLGVSI